MNRFAGVPLVKPWPTAGTVIATALTEIINANANPLGGTARMRGIVQVLDAYGISLPFIQHVADLVREIPDDEGTAVFLMLRGQTDRDICETLDITKMTYWRWRQPGGRLYPIFQEITESGFLSQHYDYQPLAPDPKIVPSLRPKKERGRRKPRKTGHHPDPLPD